MNEKEWVRKNCKFAQIVQPPTPDVPGQQFFDYDPQPQQAPARDNPRQMQLDLDDESRHMTSYDAMKIIGHNEDSDQERAYSDDPTAFEPGTIPGAMIESYTKTFRVQGNIFWTPELEQQWGMNLEQSMKFSPTQDSYPTSIANEVERGDSVQVTGIKIVQTEKDWYNVTMDIQITGESEVDEDYDDYDYQDRGD